MGPGAPADPDAPADPAAPANHAGPVGQTRSPLRGRLPRIPRRSRPGPDGHRTAKASPADPTEAPAEPRRPPGQPLRIGRYTLVGWHVAAAVAVLLAPVVAVLGQALPWGSLWLWLLRLVLVGVAGYCGYRAWHTYPTDPPEPKRRPLPEPTPEVVELERPAEPPQQIVDPALYCRVCGRPLENRQDQELGVDNDCYVQHGAKRQYMANPAYAQWQEDIRRIEARELDEQALADARHARALEDWRSARERGADQWKRDLEQWHVDCARQEAFRSSPDGRRLIDRAHTWGAAAAGAVGLLVLSLF